MLLLDAGHVNLGLAYRLVRWHDESHLTVLPPGKR